MILFPPAKINLGLRVIGKRPDGYHEIETCMHSVGITDVLELLPADAFSFQQTGRTVDGAPSDNLCVRAYELMRSTVDIPPVYMHLRKEIPMGAGLGGGSADAAFVLRGLNMLFQTDLSNEKMKEMAAQLGSDCSFFIEDVPQKATGRGEKLTPISVDLQGFWLHIVNPGIHVSTAEAYSGVRFSEETKPLGELLAEPVELWRSTVVNDFEHHIFERYPVIGKLKNTLYEQGAVYAAMSGSGASVFGIFRAQPTPLNNGMYERIVPFNS